MPRRIPHHRPSDRHQRGSALIEALVAFLVLSLGMLLVAKMQSHLRLHSDLARQRTEAVRLAQQEIERLRAFPVVTTTAGARSYDSIASTAAVTTAAGYTLTRSVDASAWVNAKTVSVLVAWTDRAGAARQVVLNSIVDAADPALSGALGLGSAMVARPTPLASAP